MKKTKLINWASCALVTSSFIFTSTTQAALFFWSNGGGDALFNNSNNWSPTGNPGGSDLAVANNNSLAAITINGNWTVDSLRMSDGGSVVQNSGTLTMASGGDTGLWIGEFGNNICNYTLNGGSIVLNDVSDNFDIGRNNGAYAIFNMNGGMVTNTGANNSFFVGRFGGSFGQVNMTAGVLNGPNADTHIGLDGAANWFQSGGTFNCAGLQIGRFASPFADVELSGSAIWNAGLVLLADGHGVFTPPNSGPVDLKIIGTNVTFNSQGLVVRTYGNLTFDAQGVGVSTMHLNNGIMLLQSATLYLNNLPAATALNQTLVLIDQIGSYPGPDTQFANAPAGSVYSAGTYSWQLKYQGTNIVLVSVPSCVAPTIGIQPQTQYVELNSSATFSVGAGGSSLLYQWQTNGVAIPGANSSTYTIASAQNSDGAVTYRVVVSNACSGLSVTSSNVSLNVFPGWVFYSWINNNGTGSHLFNDTNNWSPSGIPIADAFAFVGGSPNSTNLLIINADCQADTMRTGGGTSVLHTNGTLTIWTGLHGDNGLYIGDNGDPYGDGVSRYTLNGGKIVSQDNDGFQVGRNGSAVSVFTFLSGSITNTAGDTHIGLDGFATWNQTGGTLTASGIQIARFAATNGVVNLSSNAVWNVGLVLMADGHGVFTPRNTNACYMNIIGPNVTFKSTGLVLWPEANLTFNGAGGGISMIDFGGGQFLLNGGSLFVTNLPTVQSNGQQIVLMKNIGNYTGSLTQFPNATNGTVFGAWKLQYQTTNIVLVALPIINISSTTVSGGNVTLKFNAGTTDTASSFTLQGATSVSGPYADIIATITQVSPGVFQTVTPVSGPMHFYRIRR
jgi:hypothetical protein